MAASANHLAAGLRPLPHSRQPRLAPPFSPLPSPRHKTREEKRRGRSSDQVGQSAARSAHDRPATTARHAVVRGFFHPDGRARSLAPHATPRHATDRASPAPTHAMDPARAPPQGPPRSTAPSASARPRYLTTRRHGHGWTFPCCHALEGCCCSFFVRRHPTSITSDRLPAVAGRPTIPATHSDASVLWFQERWPPLYIAGGAPSCRAHGTHPFKGLAADHKGQLGAPLCPCRRLITFPWTWCLLWNFPWERGNSDHTSAAAAAASRRAAATLPHTNPAISFSIAEQPCQLGGQVAGQAEGGEEGQREAVAPFVTSKRKLSGSLSASGGEKVLVLGFLSFMPLVVSHYSVLPLEIITT
ncbi:uncharacterized protein LOC119270640 isoform X2 [Triticum dicoccoides]|uniref:uncharacterized protein LOC119270640 isoform X2 n=1 Tax=Triticum dicoccoides TaxID=85692 RepID=UPI00188E7C24|nr:uncharacterized protein LOC119270640 isoform X2 [Triticum dicoccoides]